MYAISVDITTKALQEKKEEKENFVYEVYIMLSGLQKSKLLPSSYFNSYS